MYQPLTNVLEVHVLLGGQRHPFASKPMMPGRRCSSRLGTVIRDNLIRMNHLDEAISCSPDQVFSNQSEVGRFYRQHATGLKNAVCKQQPPWGGLYHLLLYRPMDLNESTDYLPLPHVPTDCRLAIVTPETPLIADRFTSEQAEQPLPHRAHFPLDDRPAGPRLPLLTGIASLRDTEGGGWHSGSPDAQATWSSATNCAICLKFTSYCSGASQLRLEARLTAFSLPGQPASTEPPGQSLTLVQSL